jgi:multidrug efflux pump subunit AcrB
MGNYLLRAHAPEHIGEQMRAHDAAVGHPARTTRCAGSSMVSRCALKRSAAGMSAHSAFALNRRKQVIVGFAVSSRFRWCWCPGPQLLPAVDTGQISIHVRAPVGTRIEETAACSTDRRPHPQQLPPAKSPA